MGYNLVKSLGSLAAATSKAQDVKYLTDVKIDVSARVYITIAGTAVDVMVTLNGGTTWDTLGTLSANTHTEYTIRVKPGDVLNFRTHNASGITLDYFRVDLVAGI